jgi:hypothetical protein
VLTASCHCGAVRVEVARRPRQLTECNCSICRRYGALWAYYSRKTVRIIAKRGVLAVYTWGNRSLEFYHCRRCGSVTHHERSRKSPSSTIAVNARLLRPQVIASIRVRQFDGASRLGFTTF